MTPESAATAAPAASVAPTATVAVQNLRVGMYVHLDLGWMAHPFPLSSFRIATPEQIDTIRGLGVKRLRWVPEKSLLHAPGAGLPAMADAALSSSATPPPPPPAAETPEQAAARERRALLALQHGALQRCEQQYGEANRAWRAALDAVPAQPAAARAATEALTGALLDKMLGDGDVSIRLLASGSGDRAAGHALNVAVIALLMGRCFGLSRDEMLDLGVGALLHDVGKIDLAERLRHPDDHWTSAEHNAYHEHVAAGIRHGRRMGMSAGALLVLAQHHEHADGSGFPLRLNGDRMTIGARIVALVNRYDNLCNPAQIARALTPHEALSLLFAQSRGKYDATVLNAFIRMMGVYPAGSLVQLTDDRYALVTSSNTTRPLKPCVLVHDGRGARRDALIVNLDTTPDLGIRRSLNPAKLPRDALDFLAPKPRVAYFFEQHAVEELEACA